MSDDDFKRAVNLSTGELVWVGPKDPPSADVRPLDEIARDELLLPLVKVIGKLDTRVLELEQESRARWEAEREAAEYD